MNYTGKLYGKVGEIYFDTGKTSEDWDKMEAQITFQPPQVTEAIKKVIAKWSLVLLKDLIIANNEKPPQVTDITVYEIDFDGHVKVKLIVSNNKIDIEAAMNGYGNQIPLSDIKIKDLTPTGEKEDK